MLHYAVNRPIGALLGESDLTSMIPWLLRYSRMLEDRAPLHWAVSQQLTDVNCQAELRSATVPSNKIDAKREQYRTPPEDSQANVLSICQANPSFGLAIIVKDESETWDVATPTLHGSDASHDLKAVRGMIDAGSAKLNLF